MGTQGRPRKFDRAAALAAAMELFWEHGYEGTSLNMLTSAMGISPTSLYSSFGSKDTLFLEAVNLYNSAGSPTEQALSRPSTREAIEAMFRDNADAYVDADTPLGCMVVLSGINLSSKNEHIGPLLSAFRDEDHAKIDRRIRRGVAEQELPEALDTASLASYCLTVLQGLSIQARDGRTREQTHSVIDHAMVGWDAIVSRAKETGSPYAEGTGSSETDAPAR